MKNIIKIAQNIFSVKNKKHHKILKILGIKLNFKNYKKILKIKNVQIDELNNNYKQVCNILQEKENLIKKLYIDHDKIANQTQQIDELHTKYNKLFNYIKYESTPTIINNVGELLGLSNNTDNKQIMKKNLTQVEIEIFSYCNRTCWFCPNSIIDRHSENHFMPEEQYLKILEQLKEINYSNIITYSRYNEPLSNREIFIKRIKQARKYCPNAFIRTNSNGDFLTSLEYLDEIAAAGINEIDVQCYLNENEEFLKKKIEQYKRDMESSKSEYEKTFAYEKELSDKQKRQAELNAMLDLEKNIDEEICVSEQTNLKVSENEKNTYTVNKDSKTQDMSEYPDESNRDGR